MQRDIHQHLNTCKLIYSLFTKQGLYAADAPRATSPICKLCNGFHWTATYNIERKLICINIHLFIIFLFDYSATKNKNSWGSLNDVHKGNST